MSYLTSASSLSPVHCICGTALLGRWIIFRNIQNRLWKCTKTCLVRKNVNVRRQKLFTPVTGPHNKCAESVRWESEQHHWLRRKRSAMCINNSLVHHSGSSAFPLHAWHALRVRCYAFDARNDANHRSKFSDSIMFANIHSPLSLIMPLPGGNVKFLQFLLLLTLRVKSQVCISKLLGSSVSRSRVH